MNTWKGNRLKFFLISLCTLLAVAGFMYKLPSAFRGIDKELHAAFYFLAAAFLNILFSVRHVFKHALIFAVLYVFGMSIELAQEYSNQFFRSRIHGRYDPEDVSANLKGLIAFSVVWVMFTGSRFLFPSKRNPVPVNVACRSCLPPQSIESNQKNGMADFMIRSRYQHL